MIVALPMSARALDAARPIDQLRHTRWTLGDGAPGNIKAIVQGRDGFLWLGTSTGLYRFDGISFEYITPADDDPRRSLQVTALLAAANGDIWVGYDFGGIGRYHAGRLLNANPWRSKGGVDSIVEDRDGTIWVAADSDGKLLLSRLRRGQWSRVGAKEGVAPRGMAALFATKAGDVYLARQGELLRLSRGADHFTALPFKPGPGSALADDSAGRLWLADATYLRRLGADGHAVGSAIALPKADTPYIRRRMRIDRDGTLWLTGQNDGLARVSLQRRAGREVAHLESYDARQGLSATLTLGVFEDREGNVWIGTPTGLDRFAAGDLAQSAFSEGLVTGFAGGGRTEDIFVAGVSGVYRLRPPPARPELIFSKSSMGVLCAGSQGVLAVALDASFVLRGGRSVRVSKTRDLGDFPVVTCAADTAGRFHAGLDRLYDLDGTHLVRAPGEAGTAAGAATLLRSDGKGALIAYRGGTGVRRITGGTVEMLWKPLDIAIGFVKTFTPTRTGFLLGGESGLARYDGHGFAVLSARRYPFLGGVTGVAQTADGETWVIAAAGIVRMATSALDAAFAHPGTPIEIKRFGLEEGYRSRSNAYETNDVVQDSSGRLWFATNRGLAWIDHPLRSINRLPPPVVICALIVGDVSIPVGTTPIRLAAGTNRVQIEFSALSLVDARANRFRYRLSGVDRKWIEAGREHEASYTNLGPGRYVFHVMAANNDGVWSKTGASLTFEIAPRFVETTGFLLLCVVSVLLLAWWLYRWRLKLISERTRSRIEAQMAERERIARELHDTLLQGVQALLLRLQRVANTIPVGTPARASIDTALEATDDVLVEGRDRVRDLRRTSRHVALEERVKTLEVAHFGPVARVVVEGTARRIKPAVIDEAFAIIAEAVANARAHARASHVVVTLAYTPAELAITVHDDGVGIDPAIRRAGRREGHFGLTGMRERAVRLDGTFEIALPPAGGTSVRVTFPAEVAYRDACPTTRRWHLLRRAFGGRLARAARSR